MLKSRSNCEIKNLFSRRSGKKISKRLPHRVDSRTNQPWKGDQAIRKIIWTPALNKAGIKYRNPCQTRHTFVSMQLSRGENPIFAAQQMGHKDWCMIIKVYGRWIPQLK